MKRLCLALILLLATAVLAPKATHAQSSIPVSIPDLTGLAAGTSIDIPVAIDAAISESQGVLSYDLEVQYDASLLNITGARNTGTLTDGWDISDDNPSSGQINVSSTSGSALSGGPGTLVILEAEVNPGVLGNSTLAFVQFRFNEGTPSATATDGNASVGNSLVINEIHADPASGSDGDANGDGIRSADDDEFIEIVNAGPSSIDLSGYTLSDGNGVRFTFPASTTLAPNVAAVVFGGGTPTGIPGLVFTASTLGLNNGGDTVTLSDGADNAITAATYGAEANDDQSVTRSPDFSGPFVPHTEATDPDELYSPGRTAGGSELPVELTSLDAVRDGRNVVLQWTTASETNNSGFAVQQRVNGTFQEIGFVDGAGTTSRTQRYDYRVSDLSTGTHVFRLVQVDFDGATTSSREVEITIPLDKRFSLESAYPNPFRTEATFTLKVQETQEVRVTLFNALGQRVQTIFAGTVRAGTPATFAINGTALPSGVYLYRVQGRTFSTSKQITRVK